MRKISSERKKKVENVGFTEAIGMFSWKESMRKDRKRNRRGGGKKSRVVVKEGTKMRRCENDLFRFSKNLS